MAGAWLIEEGISEVGAPRYLKAHPCISSGSLRMDEVGVLGWTDNPWEALWFVRQEDAEKARICIAPGAQHVIRHRVAYHEFDEAEAA